ncbi:MAG: phospholipase [Solirubrobacteraceae bacterium]|nr:phospholipase [Solirubrobacteraceae bacterium]
MPGPSGLTRRETLRAGAAAAAGLAASGSVGRALDAMASAPRHGSLADLEHIVVLVQENRSFDHVLGTLRGVRGFDDHPSGSLGSFAQPGYDVPGFDGRLLPFHLDSHAGPAQCTSDVTHAWGPQHRSFDGGAMDGFVREHVKSEGTTGGALTMGYYTRADLPFQYALADAFTVCDGYHCSVLGPSYPNQVHLVSGWLDPAGRFGGPVVEDVAPFSLTWTTMPEQLRSRGVSWKAYSAPDNYTVEQIGDAPFWFFEQYRSDPGLFANGILPSFPGDFEADVATGALPSVSWVYAPIEWASHPPFPISWGEYAIARVLDTLTSNPGLWAKTALIVTYDENGGFFDHVRPPVAPPGTPGEYLTAAPLPAAAKGLAGPVGLGFRVPTFVVSPFSRGGYVCSDVFDHTSVLRLIERRFGAEVPHLSSWRRTTTGDLTTAFDFRTRDTRVPRLPATTLADQGILTNGCPTQPLLLADREAPLAATYTVPPNHMPTQEPGTRKRRHGRRPRRR